MEKAWHGMARRMYGEAIQCTAKQCNGMQCNARQGNQATSQQSNERVKAPSCEMKIPNNDLN